MIDLAVLTPFGRKQWVKRKWDEYEKEKNTEAIKLAKLAYETPTAKEWEDKLDKSKWKTNIDRKVNYLLARPPIAKGYQARLDSLLDFIKESAREFILRGSLIWIVQGDGEAVEAEPYIMNSTIAVYSDESKEEPVAFIRKRTEIELEPATGAENEIEFYEVYYGTSRSTFCYSDPTRDREETLVSVPLFIELGKTGDAPLYAYVCRLLEAFDKIMKHQDTTVEKNTKPLVEVKGYQGDSDSDLDYAVNQLSIARVAGDGGVVIHNRNMDSTSIDIWAKRLSQEFYEAMATVGKDNELQYAMSGKAMDRLFIDMENSARDLASVLEKALKEYFSSIGLPQFDIIWNTDRPVDDVSTIAAIAQSQGVLSQETILEQHPWVDDVEKELQRLAAEGSAGMLDLVDPNEFEHNHEEDYDKVITMP